MIVTNDLREVAHTAFLDVPSHNKVLNATVRIVRNDDRAQGSGVIIDVDSKRVHILTAKHLLCTLSVQTAPDAENPESYATAVRGVVHLEYGVDGLLESPQNQAEVSAIRFTESSRADWRYDLMVLESTDERLRTFAHDNNFAAVRSRFLAEYQSALAGAQGLDRRRYSHFQLGYGDGRDASLRGVDPSKYKDFSKKVQCKISLPEAADVLPGQLISTNAAENTQATFENALLLVADATNSTGPGDSGGPLICVKRNDHRAIPLVLGVTTGANFFAEGVTPESDDHIHNNVVTWAWPFLNHWVNSAPG